MGKEKKIIKREDWKSKFYLIGTPKIDETYTYKIDEYSERSEWIYNGMNLGIWCGEKFGTIYADCMGGYSKKGDTVIYAHGKKEDNSDDFDKKIVVNWEDRFNEDVLEQIGDLCFIKVGLEKTDKGNIFEKKFLSEYDAIAYVKEHLTNDMVVYVSGDLKYSSYNDNTKVNKKITSILLSIDKETKQPTTPDKFKASFTQSILIDKDSVSLKNVDKDKGVLYVNAKVLDFLKEYNGVKLVNAKGEEKGGQFPYTKQFEFPLNLENEKQCKTVYEKLFKVKKGITQLTMEGEFVEGGAVVTATWDDVPNDIKDLVEIGVYTKEEALSKCTANGSRERRMVLKRPVIKLVGDDKIPVVQKFEEKYEEDDLVLDYLFKDVESNDEVPFNEDTEVDSMDWLNQLS